MKKQGNDQPGLFDGPALRDQGISKVMQPARAQKYGTRLEHALRSFQVGDEITAEHLTAIAGLPPPGLHPNVIGASVFRMAQQGMLQDTGRSKRAARVSRHAAKLTVWRVVRRWISIEAFLKREGRQ